MVKSKYTKERRKWIRAKRILSIQYRNLQNKKNKEKNQWHLSTTHDMSIGGIAFFTEQEFRPGDKLEIRVIMSGVLEIFSGIVKVVRKEKRNNGAHFLTAVAFDENKKKKTKRQTTEKNEKSKRKLRRAKRI